MVLVTICCKETGYNSSKSKKANLNPNLHKNKIADIDTTQIAFDLCEIYGADQITRLSPGFEKKWERVIWPIDTINFKKFIGIVKKYGYPNQKLLGERYNQIECVQLSATAIMLHNPHRLINEKEYLNLFLAEVDKGNLEIEFLAEVLDKYYWVRRDEKGNRKLLLGTDWGKPCLKYRKKSDSLRKIIGLKPLIKEDFINCK